MATGPLLLLVRILLAAMFLASGYSALSNIEGATGYFASLGLEPAALVAWAVAILELIGGVSLVVGFQTRRAAAVLALFTFAATYVGHYGQGGDDAAAAFMHTQMLLKDLAAAGGLILLCLHGPGRLSVDASWGAG